MSLITIIYQAVLFSTAVFFVLLIGSYITFLLRRKNAKRKAVSAVPVVQKSKTSREAILEIKKRHNESVNLARNYGRPTRQIRQHPLRQTRYDILNDNRKPAVKTIVSHNTQNGMHATASDYFEQKNITLDFYRSV